MESTWVVEASSRVKVVRGEHPSQEKNQVSDCAFQCMLTYKFSSMFRSKDKEVVMISLRFVLWCG